MGVQTLREGAKYRIFVDALGGAGRRRQFTEVVYGPRELAEKRLQELRDLRDNTPDLNIARWPKLHMPPHVYARLRRIADEAELSPEAMVVEMINAAAE